ncbi:hypothetical protein [Streptomyces sp. PU_AKi4]|uniref:hypothetical protein n=1 Tax=Streptomyces sp. PU_AKi4 TaxID=2800809 RepID=UPI00352549D4
MQTSTISAGRTIAAAVGAILVTGCGTDAGPSAPATASAPASPSAAVPFGQGAVLKDLRAAVTAAGLAGSKVEAGFGVSHEPPVRAATEKERKVAALAVRLAPCVVVWTPTEKRYSSPDAVDPASTRRQLDAVLSGLAARGWKEASPPKEAPVENIGAYFMASYKKGGWFINARHIEASALDRVTVMATKEACFDRLTDKERALIEE